MRHKRIAILLVISFLLSLFTITIVTINIFAQEETWVEMVSERTRNGKKFQGQINPNRFALDLSIGAVHYDRPDWKDIDNTIVSSTANVPQLGLANWEMTQDDYEWFALETLNTVPMWLFRNRNMPDSFITFNPQALQWTNDLDQISQIATIVSDTIGEVSGNSIHWENAYGSGRNLTLFTNPNRMVKHLTLESYPGDPPSFITDGENASLELRFIFDTPSGPNLPDIFVNGILWERRERVQTANEVEFRIDNETLYWFAKPLYFDSNVSDENNSAIGQMVLTRQGGNVIIGVRVPLGFLQSAIYPVTIDPTVDLGIGASSDDALQLTTDAVLLTSTTMISDRANEHIGLRWTGITVPVGATINDARVGITIHGATNDEPIHQIRGELTADPGTFTTTTDDIDSRTRTANSTQWNSEDLGARVELWEWGASSAGWGNGVNLNDIVQEIVDLGGWASGNAMVMIWEQHTENSGRDLGMRTYDHGNQYESSLNITYTSISATCEALTVVITNPSGQLFFNGSTDDPIGGLWQEENVSEDFQEQLSTSAINITNDDTAGACDVTLELLTSPGSGRTMKFNTTSTAPTPDFNNIPVGSNITIVNLASEATQAIWLWIDLDDSQGGQATPTLRVDTELP